MKKTKFLSTALLFFIAMIWGFAFVAQVDGVKYIGSFTMNGVRFALGALSLTPVAFLFERGKRDRTERKRTITASLLAGSVLFLASTFQQLGIEMTGSAGVAGFITGLYTVLIPVACFLFFKQKTGLNVWLGAILGILGLFMLCYKAGEGFSFGLGELLLFVGALFWTAHVIVIDRFAKKIRPLHFSWGQFIVCTVLGIVSMFIFEEPTVGGILEAKWAILYCGVLSVGVAYTLQVVAQRRAEPTFAAIVLSTESVFSAIGGALFGIDKISALGYVGCAVIFTGIILSQIDLAAIKKKKKS